MFQSFFADTRYYRYTQIYITGYFKRQFFKELKLHDALLVFHYESRGKCLVMPAQDNTYIAKLFEYNEHIDDIL